MANVGVDALLTWVGCLFVRFIWNINLNQLRICLANSIYYHIVQLNSLELTGQPLHIDDLKDGTYLLKAINAL